VDGSSFTMSSIIINMIVVAVLYILSSPPAYLNRVIIIFVIHCLLVISMSEAKFPHNSWSRTSSLMVICLSLLIQNSYKISTRSLAEKLIITGQLSKKAGLVD
jgi:hypothetical protein